MRAEGERVQSYQYAVVSAELLLLTTGYQLAAKALRRDLHVRMAAYGDYGPGYIGTAAAYREGGYETSTKASNVAPQAEQTRMAAMKELLEVE